MSSKYWPENVEKARVLARQECKLLVLEYDASADADWYSAMTREEFETTKSKQYNNVYAGWIVVKEDYTKEA